LALDLAAEKVAQHSAMNIRTAFAACETSHCARSLSQSVVATAQLLVA
jgi:hypothetical protein